ncbi:MAG TPA: ABC transporter permease [Acidimicrobiales bacterium]|nr:ABC transporter permease [Acidimicrobiales bacterium]
MWRVAWRGLAAHKLRTMLTAFAVMLGVSLMSGTYILTDTIDASYGQLVGAAFSRVSDVIVPNAPLGGNNQAQISTLDAATLRAVGQVPGVDRASGQIINGVSLFGPAGKALPRNAFNYVLGLVPPPFEPLQVTSGRYPRGAGEADVDQATASRGRLHVGGVVGVAGAGAVRYYQIVGTVDLPGSSSFAGAGAVLLTLPQAQLVAGEVGRYDQIEVTAKPGVAPATLRDRLGKVLGPAVTVRTNAQEISQLSDNFASNIAFFRDFLLVFAYVALFVGAFIILNTFSVTVAQRAREIALVRAMGASARQVRLAVLAESIVLSVFGAAAGLAAGVGVAPALSNIFKAFGANLPANGMVLEARTVIVSMVAGVAVAVASAWAPALRATRVPPLAALRDGIATPPGRFSRHSVAVSAAVLAVGLAMVVVGLGVVGSGALAGVGALVVFAGIALFSPKVVPGLARVVGALVVWRGVTGVLARENIRRQPGRTAATSAALMVGLALVTLVAVLASGAQSTIDSAVRAAFAGNLIVQGGPSDNQGLPASLASALRQVPGVGLVAAVNFSEAEVTGVNGAQPVDGVGAAALARLYRLDWEAGDRAQLAHLRGPEALATESFADAHHYRVGSRLALLTASGRRLGVVVTGVVSSKAGLLGSLTMDRAFVQEQFAQSNDGVDFIGYAPGADGVAVQRSVDRLLAARYPQAQALTEAQYDSQEAGNIDSVLDLVYVLLALAVLVSLCGLINTLVLAVHERRRELGLLRAVGTSRRQVRQMVRYESVITALIGAVIGLVVGTVAAAALARSLVGGAFVLSFPIATLTVMVVLAATAGVFAAALPARRAARLDILAAIATE